MADLYLVTVKSVGPGIESLRSNAQLCIFTGSVHLCARQRVSTQDNINYYWCCYYAEICVGNGFSVSVAVNVVLIS